MVIGAINYERWPSEQSYKFLHHSLNCYRIWKFKGAAGKRPCKGKQNTFKRKTTKVYVCSSLLPLVDVPVSLEIQMFWLLNFTHSLQLKREEEAACAEKSSFKMQRFKDVQSKIKSYSDSHSSQGKLERNERQQRPSSATPRCSSSPSQTPRAPTPIRNKLKPPVPKSNEFLEMVTSSPYSFLSLGSDSSKNSLAFVRLRETISIFCIQMQWTPLMGGLRLHRLSMECLLRQQLIKTMGRFKSPWFLTMLQLSIMYASYY